MAVNESTLVTIRYFVAGAAFILAILSAVVAWPKHAPTWCDRLVVVIWTLGPPMWFMCESYLFDQVPNRIATIDELRAGQELASKFWAGVGALLTALYAFGRG